VPETAITTLSYTQQIIGIVLGFLIIDLPPDSLSLCIGWLGVNQVTRQPFDL